MGRFIIISLLLTLTLFANGQDELYLKQMQDTADKLVASFWGQDNFDRYIKLDKENSTFLVWGKMWEKRSKFNQPLNFRPNFFHYKYLVVHPAFHGDTARISFYIDSTRKLQIGFQPEGLYQPSDLNNLKTINQATAIATAKKLGLPKGKGQWYVSLQWNEIDHSTLDLKPNSTLQDFIKGHYVWAVKSTLNKSYQNGCYYYNKRVFYIDLVTGKLIGKGDVGKTD